ncbi:MAG: HNH endonuclease [Pseudomonadota bacterium]
MPRKGGANWTEEEITLAYATYVENKNQPLTSHSEAVIHLSHILRSAPINLSWKRDDSYRPVDGVRGRIGIFNRLEKGDHENVPALAEEVWKKYRGSTNKLFKKKQEILAAWEDKERIVPRGDIPFVKGEVYKRSHLHDLWGGSRQTGISPSAQRNVTFIFTGSSGLEHGYKDRWDDGVFKYVGEGQTGDMTMKAGNAAVYNHQENGTDLLLFEEAEKRSYVRFVGQFCCAGFHYEKGKSKTEAERQLIVFHLIPMHDEFQNPREYLVSDNKDSLSRLREKAAQSAPTGGNDRERKRYYYKRSIAVKRYAIARSNGVCERCDKEGPFYTSEGKPFLEVHHIMRLSDGGPDKPEWVAALCPNCHREAHYSTDSNSLNEKLLGIVKEREAQIFG